jgi:UDP-3-O-acyl-N-acetylglucosamine deacetylase
MSSIRILAGDEEKLPALEDALAAMPVDMTMPAPEDWRPRQWQTTLAQSFPVTGPATYRKGSHSTLVFLPGPGNGWWLKRLDLEEQLPIKVSVRNVWTAHRNIVLRSGSPHNYVRMTEHIIAHRLGLGLDNAAIGIDSGDPPLFNIGSLPIVEAVRTAGIVEDKTRPLRYVAVKEPVALMSANGGSYLRVDPPPPGCRKLSFDVGIDFPTAIGQQRIQFDLHDDAFMHGAHARTNCSRAQVLYMCTIGKLFADTRNLGYTRDNILIAGKDRYYNEPRMMRDGKSLEAVWHRACLDLIAALSLLDEGRLCGKVTSYKAGHALDCRLMTLLYRDELLEPLPSI